MIIYLLGIAKLSKLDHIAAEEAKTLAREAARAGRMWRFGKPTSHMPPL
jgi:hypothetical protein